MLKKYGSQLMYFSIAIIFFLTFATLYGVMGNNGALFKKVSLAKDNTKTVLPQINKNTVIEEEIRYICGDKVKTKLPTTSQLIGLDFSALVKKYPPEQGWSINDTVNNTLVLAKLDQDLCPFHRGFRHFGLDKEYLAVYEGPLGYNQKVLHREDITVGSLPEEMQNDLRRAMDYRNQSPDIQNNLKASYEFANENQLNEAMENFDEYKE